MDVCGWAEGTSSKVGCGGLRIGGGVRKWVWCGDDITAGTLALRVHPPLDPSGLEVSAKESLDTLKFPSLVLLVLLALTLSMMAS